MKVVWICHFSNPEIREKLDLSNNFVERLIRKFFIGSSNIYSDFAQWISNAIKAFEEFHHVELHVISPHYGIVKRIHSFQLKGVNYYFFKPDDDFIIKKISKKILNSVKSNYKQNRSVINELIKLINPDIIHMYGAENPYYSISALDIDTVKYPFFVSLQTLMSEDDFMNNYKIGKKQYDFRTTIERRILSNISYIGSTVQNYRVFIWNYINPFAVFFNTYLALEEEFDKKEYSKKYDFVYFAANISKAADLAIEAFAIAQKKYPELTLNIIGHTPQPFTDNLKSRIKELEIENNVVFSGRLATHKDVLNQIQYSKYALLPLKIDFISGTIREAMFSGIPVVSTITSGTPLLNEKRQSILLSTTGDNFALAENMIKLIENSNLALFLSENGLITVRELYNNRKEMEELVEVYRAIINHQKYGTEIPKELGSSNPNKIYAKQNSKNKS